MALDLLPIPETVAAIARRLRSQVDHLQQVLDGMVTRGQIAIVRYRGEHVYMLAPFVIGIYEFQLPHMDAELAAMFEEYAPALVNTVGGAKPALARVVPGQRAHRGTRRGAAPRERARDDRGRALVPPHGVHLPQGAGGARQTVLAHSGDVPRLLLRARRLRALPVRPHRLARGSPRGPRSRRARGPRSLHLQHPARADVRLQLLLVLLRVPARREGVRCPEPAAAQQLRGGDRRPRTVPPATPAPTGAARWGPSPSATAPTRWTPSAASAAVPARWSARPMRSRSCRVPAPSAPPHRRTSSPGRSAAPPTAPGCCAPSPSSVVSPRGWWPPAAPRPGTRNPPPFRRLRGCLRQRRRLGRAPAPRCAIDSLSICVMVVRGISNSVGGRKPCRAPRGASDAGGGTARSNWRGWRRMGS